jgi:hypothetical protein
MIVSHDFLSAVYFFHKCSSCSSVRPLVSGTSFTSTITSAARMPPISRSAWAAPATRKDYSRKAACQRAGRRPAFHRSVQLEVLLQETGCPADDGGVVPEEQAAGRGDKTNQNKAEHGAAFGG